MKKESALLILVMVTLTSTACFKEEALSRVDSRVKTFTGPTDTGLASYKAGMQALLEVAERERRGQYEAGFGMVESSIREKMGDFSGAVIAAYKDLSYAFSRGLIDKNTIKARLSSLEEGYAALSGDGAQTVLRAIESIRLFIDSDWSAALRLLESVPARDGQLDSFESWMRLVSRLELGSADQKDRDQYAIMQSRYNIFPEYWYRFSRSQENTELKRDSAERCVALAPSGPFAEDSRATIAESYGLKRSDGKSILIRAEIESIAETVIKTGDAESLAAMLPVLSLPDNPVTLYAVGVLRGLCSSDGIRSWLEASAEKVNGRVAERLRYITGR